LHRLDEDEEVDFSSDGEYRFVMPAIGLVLFLVFMLGLGIWILPFVILVALGTTFIALSSTIVFWIFGPPELPK
jgi:hypothetical protein